TTTTSPSGDALSGRRTPSHGATRTAPTSCPTDGRFISPKRGCTRTASSSPPPKASCSPTPTTSSSAGSRGSSIPASLRSSLRPTIPSAEAPMADPRIAKIAATLNAAAAAARITIKAQLDTIGDAAVAEVAALFPDWTPGAKVKPGDVLAWDGTLVEVIQAHTTQADWTPDRVPALFKVHRTPEMTACVAGITDAAGERFTYGGATWGG